MYTQLRLLMIKHRITLLELSNALKLNRNTVSKKINGCSSFTVEEFLKIQKTFFPTISLEKLSAKD